MIDVSIYYIWKLEDYILLFSALYREKEKGMMHCKVKHLFSCLSFILGFSLTCLSTVEI